MTALDRQFAQLQARLSQAGHIGHAEVNAATDFAIDANAAGRADLSLAMLEPLAERAALYAKLWQMLGLAYRDEQHMDKAAEAFERASALAPQDARIALGKAQIAFERGQPAAQQFAAIRAIAPQDGELALSTASALFHEGDARASEALIADMLQRHPEWLRGLEALAATRWMTGDRQDFDYCFAQAVAARPQDFALRLGWYRAVAQVENWAKAETIIANARRTFGDRIELDAIEANLATETGDDARAERLFTACQSLDDPGTKIGCIRHCLRTGQVGRAEEIGLPLTQTAAAAGVWPYMSTIWRLTGNAQARWLDGDQPFVRQYDLPVADAQLDDLAGLLRALHLMTHHPPEQSLRGGTQTQGHLFLRQEPALQAIMSLILDAVRDYVDSLPPHVDGHPLLGTARGSLLFEGAWSVRLAAQGFHVVHSHPRGWISSALYVSLPARMGPDKAGWLQLGAPPPDLRLDLAPYLEIEPKAGRLVLFPSTLWHGTNPFDDGERLTIAFDMRTPQR